MAPVNVCGLIFILMITTYEARSRPIPKSDIIAGQEFLSLFLDKNESPESQKKLQGKIKSDYVLDNQEDGFLPIETMFFSNEELLSESSNHFAYSRRHNGKLETTTTEANFLLEQSEMEEMVDTFMIKNNKKQSTENFKEEDTSKSGTQNDFLDHSSQNKTNATNIENSVMQKRIMGFSSSVVNNEKTVQLLHQAEIEDDVRVISVSVSSSVGSTRQDKDKIHERKDQLNFPEEHSEPNKFISNSHRSDFSIEEEDPLTADKESNDSINGESMNIHSIVAPPVSPDARTDNVPVASHQVRSRTQRKQDDMVPYQTIIYHDSNFQKERTTLPRSISYSSVGQSIEGIKMWREFESLFKTSKENKTDHPRHIYQPEPAKIYSQPEKVYSEPAKIYSEPAKIYGEPARIYSEPAKIYSEPARIYGEPEKVYSEPAKVYSEPAKIYSEPAKIYGEPSKVYTEPLKSFPVTATTTVRPLTGSQVPKKIIFNLDKLPYDLLNAPADDSSRTISRESQFRQQTDNNHAKTNRHYHGDKTLVTSSPIDNPGLSTTINLNSFDYNPTPEQNYEVDEAVSVMTNGRQHGVQTSPSTPNMADDDSQKVGYVVEGRNYRKYRVEEKTSDGFIVGEYGVVSHDDGSLRGVRYTADSNINPRLIYDALMKFLSL